MEFIVGQFGMRAGDTKAEKIVECAARTLLFL